MLPNQLPAVYAQEIGPDNEASVVDLGSASNTTVAGIRAGTPTDRNAALSTSLGTSGAVGLLGSFPLVAAECTMLVADMYEMRRIPSEYSRHLDSCSLQMQAAPHNEQVDYLFVRLPMYESMDLCDSPYPLLCSSNQEHDLKLIMHQSSHRCSICDGTFLIASEVTASQRLRGPKLFHLVFQLQCVLARQATQSMILPAEMLNHASGQDPISALIYHVSFSSSHQAGNSTGHLARSSQPTHLDVHQEQPVQPTYQLNYTPAGSREFALVPVQATGQRQAALSADAFDENYHFGDDASSAASTSADGSQNSTSSARSVTGSEKLTKGDILAWLSSIPVSQAWRASFRPTYLSGSEEESIDESWAFEADPAGPSAPDHAGDAFVTFPSSGDLQHMYTPSSSAQHPQPSRNEYKHMETPGNAQVDVFDRNEAARGTKRQRDDNKSEVWPKRNMRQRQCMRKPPFVCT